MSSTSVKNEFFQWISSLDLSTLADVDKKFLNLLINNFDTIIPHGTAGGARAKKIGQLIEKNKSTLSPDLPDVNIQKIADSEIPRSIAELKIGPFRGFSAEETFTFDKKYTFMYGPNGSGKSSFCEGLEYALLGSIEEAESKRINVALYATNTQVGTVNDPIIYGLNADKEKVMITQNPIAYRFSFIEKNRIDSFARIAATTAGIQQDRIATLFGLDAFSEFVNGFTDILDARYLTLVNQKEIDFNAENQKIEASKTRILDINNALSEQTKKGENLLKEVAQENINTLENLKLFLTGEDGTKGRINYLQEIKATSIPIDIDASIYEKLNSTVKDLQGTLASLNLKISELAKSSSEVNYKDLYTAIEAISKEAQTDKSVCPACKTPTVRVTVEPFANAVSELAKMEQLATLQNEIQKTVILISKKIKDVNKNIEELNKFKNIIDNKEPVFQLFTEFAHTGITSIDLWKELFTTELNQLEKAVADNINLSDNIQTYNISLKVMREEKEKIDKELLACQVLKQKLDEITALTTALSKEKTDIQKTIGDFINQNKKKLEEIEELKNEICINIEYAKSYQSLIGKLKGYRNALPSQLAAGLSDKTKEFYNIINDHDPNFEKLEYLKLPTTAGEKITVRFYGDTKEYDALLIFSEGHIKVLGLSLLLSKVVNEDLGFIIFDDIVNAIDDEHRDGIAELLLNKPDIKERQLIITCHGEMFISKLEHKLGASTAGKEVKSYRFVPSDVIEARGVKISIGDSKHYLLLAKKSLIEDARKDVAYRCRQAIESISEQLWSKLNRRLNVSLTVKMRSPGARPDLSTVVDSLIKELNGISGLNELQAGLKQLKEKYPWSLLNKGTHEQGDLPELERKDVADLLTLVEEIERKTGEIKLEVSSGLKPAHDFIDTLEEIGVTSTKQ